MESLPFNPRDVIERGRRIYEETLRPLLEAEHRGEFLVINVETGEYELDKVHLRASQRAAVRFPGAPRYAVRVGRNSLGRIGARVKLPKL